MAQRQRCASAGLRPGQLEKPSFRRCDVRCKEQVHGRPVVLVDHPIRYDEQIPELRVKGITVGEHTREIFAEHGDTQAQIDGSSNTDPDGAQGASGAVTA
jgi:crotonobetainyl-CoA:carnitine CoA-transferase CaiB-like acyl-CoA transferase